MKRISAIEGEERYTGRGSAPPLPFSFVLIEWTSGPVAVLPFVGNSAVPRTAVRVAITLRRPEIVSLLPEDLQNQKRIRAGSGVALVHSIEPIADSSRHLLARTHITYSCTVAFPTGHTT